MPTRGQRNQEAMRIATINGDERDCFGRGMASRRYMAARDVRRTKKGYNKRVRRAWKKTKLNE